MGGRSCEAEASSHMTIGRKVSLSDGTYKRVQSNTHEASRALVPFRKDDTSSAAKSQSRVLLSACAISDCSAVVWNCSVASMSWCAACPQAGVRPSSLCMSRPSARRCPAVAKMDAMSQNSSRAVVEASEARVYFVVVNTEARVHTLWQWCWTPELGSTSKRGTGVSYGQIGAVLAAARHGSLQSPKAARYRWFVACVASVGAEQP